MLTEKHRADRRRAIRALIASALAVALTVTFTAGVPADQGVPPLGPGLSFAD